MIVSGKVEVIGEAELLETSVTDIYDVLTKDEYFVVSNIPRSKKTYQYYGIKKHNGILTVYKINDEQGDIIKEKYKLSTQDNGEITENVLYIIRAMRLYKDTEKNIFSIYGKIYTWDRESV